MPIEQPAIGSSPTRRHRVGLSGRAPWFALLEIAGLSTLAVAQPVFDQIGRADLELGALAATRAHVAIAGAVIAFGVPLALWGLIVGIGAMNRRAGRYVGGVIVLLLAATAVLVVIKSVTPIRGAPLALLAGVAGAATLVARRRFAAVRHWLRVLGAAPPVVLALFVAGAPVSPDAAAVSGVTGSLENHVLVVVLDELPLATILDGDGHIDGSGFPTLAALAADATWFRNTTAAANRTDEAVPTIITGREAGTGLAGVPTIVGWLSELAPTSTYSPLGNSCPDVARCTQIGRTSPTGASVLDFARRIWLDRVALSDPPPRVQVDGIPSLLLAQDEDVAEIVASLGGPRPDVHVLHLLLPHQPWLFTPRSNTYRGVDFLGWMTSDARWPNEELAALGRQRHVLQARHADRVLGQMVGALREAGTYDDSLIVVVADHGAGFDAEAHFRGITPQTAADLVWVPLLVKAPGQRAPDVDDRPMRLVDVVSLIADRLDLDLPFPVDGRSEGTGVDPESVHIVETYWQPGPGGTLRIDRSIFESVLMAGYPTVGDDDLRYHRAGCGADLVGEPVTADGMSELTATMHGEEQGLAAVDVDSGALPLWTAGRLRGAVVADTCVGFVLDGVLVATSGVFESPIGEATVAAVLPETRVRAGANVLELVEIVGSSDRPAAHRIAWRSG